MKNMSLQYLNKSKSQSKLSIIIFAKAEVRLLHNENFIRFIQLCCLRMDTEWKFPFGILGTTMAALRDLPRELHPNLLMLAPNTKRYFY